MWQADLNSEAAVEVLTWESPLASDSSAERLLASPVGAPEDSLDNLLLLTGWPFARD